MAWTVRFHDSFEAEFDALAPEVRDGIFSLLGMLRHFGPTLGRPWVDTLKDSRHSNMKELRFEAAEGVWRIAFAFDPKRQGILLVAGDKSGVGQRRFYKSLLAKADSRFEQHLRKLRAH